MSAEPCERGEERDITPGLIGCGAIPEKAERIAQRARLQWRIKTAFQFRHIWPDRAQTRADIRNLIDAYRSMPA